VSATVRLSEAAVAYAAALGSLDGAAVAGRLYEFGRLPVTDEWLSTVRAHGGVRGFLDVARIGPNTDAHARRWLFGDPAVTDRSWLDWRRVESGRSGSRATRARRAVYKLYVAPAPAALPGVLHDVGEVAARSRAFAFKVAASAALLLRPDKVVLHFRSRDALHATADTLRAALHGAPAQPVPFTAQLHPDGLLSWGMDPPAPVQLGATSYASWRQWLTARLGTYLAIAREAGAPAPTAVALRRLARDGVDVETWAPDRPRWDASTDFDA
jgi:hypothetical protein